MAVSESVDPCRPAIHLRILGPLRVRRGGAEADAGPPQQQCLLALLLAREGHPVSVNELIDLLWGPDAPPSAVNTIHKYVGALRRLLEPGLPPRTPGAYLTRHGHGYRFAAGPDALDLVLFRRIVAEAKAYARRGEPDAALGRYTAALRLGHGPAGDGLSGTPAARATFARLDGEFAAAVLDAAEIAVRLRRPSMVLAPLRRAAELDPLDERVQAGLVTTLAAAGRQAEALAAYRSIRERLADELGIDPGPDLREAHRRVLTQAGPPTRRVVARRRRWLRPSRRSAEPVDQAAEFTLNVIPEYERAESKTFDSGE
ncbi:MULTISPECIES: BTAD domain-containing putative transcriptional regulator [unclassified Micromonospora]|uniref:AfsR/SARP family transcriptional regulator n=1 Tax=unclassified Micromonospora TaxID=2617518 RepID=UPI0036374F84